MTRKTAIWYYILSAYVVLQFIWWGYSLLKIPKNLDDAALASRRFFMVFGEGSIFLVLLFFGLWKIRSSIKKEFSLSQRQSNFMLSVTHELKTPLASNKLYLQTIRKRDLNLEKRNELLDKALLDNKRLESMVENILTASRLENKVYDLQNEPIEVHEVLQNSVKEWNLLSGDNRIKLEIASEVETNLDLWVLQTCISNLIENAVKYTEQGAIFVRLEKGMDNFTIEICDEGPGIPREKQNEIFTKFFRMENEETRKQKGTGLGLYIVAQFSQLLRGKIEYLDNKPNGSVFRLTLPI